uniref:UDP-N-acetylglucosamine transferase subunit ALG13 n=1 Tax=Dromaius novaehollandiae TaxID=8790 RepID=A0A8C4J7E6_DRONO
TECTFPTLFTGGFLGHPPRVLPSAAPCRPPPLISLLPQVLQSRGYRKLVLQIGRGAQEPAPLSTPAFVLEAFRFKDSLAEDLRRADLVISHAGAGSCLETLEEGKPLIVVINEKLMNNHQLELAKQLHRDGHPVMVGPIGFWVSSSFQHTSLFSFQS